MPEVYVVVIHHKAGVDVLLGKTEAAGRFALAQWAADWWKREMGERPMPEDREERIKEYFDHQASLYKGEWFEAHFLPVRTLAEEKKNA
jgi:hypothetical protein